MPKFAFVDNDVLFKISAYDAAVELLVVLSQQDHDIGALSVARYVVEDLIKRRGRIANKQRALDAFASLSSAISWLEPEPNEISLAATYEEEAQKQNLSLDTGESLLLAILVLRMASLLLTGDKRAIYAIEQLAELIGPRISNRVGCFEQLMLSIVAHVDPANFRAQVCVEVAVDKSMSICFACHSGECALKTVLEGLVSYVNNLRQTARKVLVESNDLSAVTP
jgi:hypothetical protein